MRSKRVERVTLMRIVPRSGVMEAERAGVAIDGHHGALVLTRGRRGDTAREREGGDENDEECGCGLHGRHAAERPANPGPAPGKAQAKPRRATSGRAQVGVLVRELLGAAPGAAAADRAVVEVDDLVEERAAVLDREPRCAQPLRAAQRVRIAEAPIHGPGHGAGIRAEVDHAVMIGLQGLCGYRPPVGACTRRDSTGGRGLSCRCVTRREIHSWLMDMDGVLVREESMHPRRRPLHRARCAARELPFLAPHQQLDLHAPRPRGAPAHERARRPGGVDLDLRARHRAASSPTSARAARRS